jgi:hypothetical protein
MKLGLIFESDTNKQKKGVDHQVYEYMIKQLNAGLQITTQSAGNNKPQMIQNCGKVAKLLIESEHCDCIAIIWDLMPTWGGNPCRKEDVESILTKLKDEQIDLRKIKLICIEPELESIFLTDGNVLTSYKQQRSHPHPVKSFNGKTLKKNDKKAKTYISNYLERKYNDMLEAIKIVQHITDYNKIAKEHNSFKRLKEFVESLH